MTAILARSVVPLACIDVTVTGSPPLGTLAGVERCLPLFKAMAANRPVNHLSKLDELGPQWTGLSAAFDAADDDVTYWERAVAETDSREGRQALVQAKVQREKARCSMVQFLDKLELP